MIRKAKPPPVRAPRDAIFRLDGGVVRSDDVEAWLASGDPLRVLVAPWFERMRRAGDGVRELVHDGAPTACVGDVAFGYVAAFRAHASVGFFRGATLPDPARLLEGGGKAMRHVKLRPGHPIDERALSALVVAAHREAAALAAG